ncbi:hypothetical protein HMPREF9005_1795 [Actinomyces sp. oral taxon 178 str. F0338]|nr:hypothetical protein HMPREF9005_1795 [Actinomyces sp. oral taxon 178 str. F0338]
MPGWASGAISVPRLRFVFHGDRGRVSGGWAARGLCGAVYMGGALPGALMGA